MGNGDLNQEGNGSKRCGAKGRDGTPCKRRPVPTRERCKLHGGATKQGIEAGRFIHGGRSKFGKDQVLEKIAKYKKDDQVRDLRDELAILRGILHSYLEATDELLQEDKIETITKLADKIEKIVASLKVIEEGHTFTIKNVNNVLLQVVRIIQQRVIDADVKRNIASDLRKLTYISVN